MAARVLAKLTKIRTGLSVVVGITVGVVGKTVSDRLYSPGDTNNEHNRRQLDLFVASYGSPGLSSTSFAFTNHSLAYDQARKSPIWVMEHLSKEKLKGDADRHLSNFKPDYNLPELFRTKNEDFLGSGFARGHMAPAADNKSSQAAMNETFYLSNIVPQDFENNAGFWYRMETYCRKLAKKYSNVYVISGPLYLPEVDEKDKKTYVKYQVIGENNVAVPTHLYKVILVEKYGKPYGLSSFVIPNKPIGYERKLQDFKVPLLDLEKKTGVTFLPKLDRTKVQDLCKVDDCKLISKVMLELKFLTRNLKNAKSLEELEQVWKKMSQLKTPLAQFVINIYNNKRKQLQTDEGLGDENKKKNKRTSQSS